MRCHCCDKQLTEAEIQYIPATNSFEMCSICLEIAMDTAYSDGFVRPDDVDGVEILEIETLEDNTGWYLDGPTLFQPVVEYD